MVRSAVAPWADTVPESVRPITAAELIEMPDEARGYELVEVRLVRMAPSGAGHSADASRLNGVLEAFVKDQRLGRVISSEAGFRYALSDLFA